MRKDTVELIFFKSINLYCQPIFSYISSFVIAPYAPFSQSLSHIYIYMDTTTDHFTPLALRVRGNNQVDRHMKSIFPQILLHG